MEQRSCGVSEREEMVSMLELERRQEEKSLRVKKG